jgi:hypothetical protein
MIEKMRLYSLANLRKVSLQQTGYLIEMKCMEGNCIGLHIKVGEKLEHRQDTNYQQLSTSSKKKLSELVSIQRRHCMSGSSQSSNIEGPIVTIKRGMPICTSINSIKKLVDNVMSRSAEIPSGCFQSNGEKFIKTNEKGNHKGSNIVKLIGDGNRQFVVFEDFIIDAENTKEDGKKITFNGEIHFCGDPVGKGYCVENGEDRKVIVYMFECEDHRQLCDKLVEIEDSGLYSVTGKIDKHNYTFEKDVVIKKISDQLNNIAKGSGLSGTYSSRFEFNTMEFSDDGEVTIVADGGYVANGTYKISGDSLTLTVKFENDPYETWNCKLRNRNSEIKCADGHIENNGWYTKQNNNATDEKAVRFEGGTYQLTHGHVITITSDCIAKHNIENKGKLLTIWKLSDVTSRITNQFEGETWDYFFIESKCKSREKCATLKNVPFGSEISTYPALLQLKTESEANRLLEVMQSCHDSEATQKHLSQPGDGWKYQFASERYLSQSDVSNLSKSELRLMRNGIFARHGYRFKSSDLRNYFSQQPWYQPNPNFHNGMLSEIENHNVKMIKGFE